MHIYIFYNLIFSIYTTVALHIMQASRIIFYAHRELKADE